MKRLLTKFKKKFFRKTEPVAVNSGLPLYNEFTLDLETLSLDTDSVILSIGIVPFNMYSYQEIMDTLNLPTDSTEQDILDFLFVYLRDRPSSLYIKLDVLTQFPAGRTASLSTINFWKKQAQNNPEAAEVLDRHSSDIELSRAIDIIIKHVDEYVLPMNKYAHEGRVICRGYDFDCGKIDSVLSMYNKKSIWMFNRRRCSRSMLDVMYRTNKGISPFKHPAAMVAHSAIDDAAWDAAQLIYGSR